jgi:hypothetical protein
MAFTLLPLIYSVKNPTYMMVVPIPVISFQLALSRNFLIDILEKKKTPLTLYFILLKILITTSCSKLPGIKGKTMIYGSLNLL